jgi:hypothetical protein
VASHAGDKIDEAAEIAELSITLKTAGMTRFTYGISMICIEIRRISEFMAVSSRKTMSDLTCDSNEKKCRSVQISHYLEYRNFDVPFLKKSLQIRRKKKMTTIAVMMAMILKMCILLS